MHSTQQCHCTIIPRYMLQGIVEHEEDENIRATALAALQKHDHLRTTRAEHFAAVPQPREATAMQSSIIRIYDAQHGTSLPGTEVQDPGSSSDEAIKETHDWATRTDEFFRSLFSRNSIDNQGMEVVSTVHYDENYSNAFWNGSQLTFGDGDGKYFTSFTSDSDIYAHELGHGITQYDGSLVYRNQSGALNESISDVFGIMVKQHIQNETVDDSNWLIGEEVMKGKRYALRSMKAPGTAYKNHRAFGTDPQPATMDDYVNTTEDNGGVHINSGIPNHAFYLTAMKLKSVDSQLYSYSWQGAGRIWYDARYNISSNATFSEFAQKTVEVAKQLFGIDSQEEKQVRYAWADVKVEPFVSEQAYESNSRFCNII